ncbi:hypothetical protein FACS1894186_2890 [Alphaproteobacteria bacterium]|nr:hypothetical protein FACS1894186_2890 [Alphaproteobacteria bacterium]
MSAIIQTPDGTLKVVERLAPGEASFEGTITEQNDPTGRVMAWARGANNISGIHPNTAKDTMEMVLDVKNGWEWPISTQRFIAGKLKAFAWASGGLMPVAGVIRIGGKCSAPLDKYMVWNSYDNFRREQETRLGLRIRISYEDDYAKPKADDYGKDKLEPVKEIALANGRKYFKFALDGNINQYCMLAGFYEKYDIHTVTLVFPNKEDEEMMPEETVIFDRKGFMCPDGLSRLERSPEVCFAGMAEGVRLFMVVDCAKNTVAVSCPENFAAKVPYMVAEIKAKVPAESPPCQP